MSDLELQQYRRWAELMDKKSAGESLSHEELALCQRLSRENLACMREQALLDELADLDVAPDADSGALVDATLARMADEAERAEQSEVSSLKGSRVPRLVWGLGAAAVLALVATAALLPPRVQPKVAEPQVASPPSSRVELVYTAGEVSVDGKPATGGAALLPEGSRIAVARGSACLAMDPGIDLCLAEGSELVLSRVHSLWRKLDLTRGKVGVRLEPQPEGVRLSIVAEGVWSTAVGTAFTVERRADRAVRTAVMNGRVRVGSDGGQEHMVAAHQRSDVRSGNATVSALARSEESPEWALLGPAELWSDPVSSSLVVQGPPQGVDVLLDGQRVGVAPLSTLVPAGTHHVALRVDGRIALTRELTMQAGQPTVVSFEAADLAPAALGGTVVDVPSATMPARRGPALERAQSADVMLSEARRLMRNARFEAAASQYESLRAAYPDSAEAHTVLVSLAELELDRLGRPERALLQLERYLVAGGPLSEEARHLRVRALRALGQHDGERRAIEEFLDQYPGSFRVAVLQRRLHELVR